MRLSLITSILFKYFIETKIPPDDSTGGNMTLHGCKWTALYCPLVNTGSNFSTCSFVSCLRKRPQVGSSWEAQPSTQLLRQKQKQHCHLPETQPTSLLCWCLASLLFQHSKSKMPGLWCSHTHLGWSCDVSHRTIKEAPEWNDPFRWPCQLQAIIYNISPT